MTKRQMKQELNLAARRLNVGVNCAREIENQHRAAMVSQVKVLMKDGKWLVPKSERPTS